jgi:hypothetical protein
MSPTKILPSQLSYEELLNILDSSDPQPKIEQILEYTNDVVPFLTNYGITPGDTPVSKKLLYKLYKAYSKNPIIPVDFNTKVGEYITEKSNQYYFINQDNFAISKHIYKEIDKKDKTKSLTYQKHFNWFLTESNIKPGSKWLEGFILFFIYKNFCKSRRINHRLGYLNYHKFLKLHFKYKRIKENRSLWFKVDEETFNILNEEEKNVIRNARKKETRGSKKESSDRTEKTT